MEPWIWGALLLAVGIAIAVTEFFIPSGGVLGVLATVCILGGIFLAFRQGVSYGASFLAVTVVALPTLLGLAAKWWPNTPMGRRFLPPLLTSQEVLPDDERRQALRRLVGQVGRAKSPMLPSGAVLIAGQTIDAVSEGLPIDPGQAVKVVSVRGNLVIVRPTQESPAVSGDERLSQPIESLGIEPLDDQLA